MLYYSRNGKNQGKRSTSWRASLLENPPQIYLKELKEVHEDLGM
jgi:hypothetical protein